MSPRRPGPGSQRSFQQEQRFMAPGLQSIALFSKLVLDRGQGVYLYDMDGQRYLDFFAGVGAGSLGHSHPKYVAALEAQLKRVTLGSFSTPNRAACLKLLASVTPKNLTKIQLYSGGSEAVEAAIRLAKSATKKWELVGFWGGFHGKTGGVLGLLGDETKRGLGPFPPGLHLAPYADCYRCPLKLRYPDCGIACAEHLRQLLKRETAGQVAAILVEPMQGTAGNVIPPPGFLRRIQEIAREHGALLIVDEIITGFGRTGKMWGCQHDGVVPDVLTIGKAMGGGFPVSGLISTPELTSAPPFGLPSGSSSSYGGNPLASTAAHVTLKTILEERLVENSARVGAWLLRRLQGLKEKYPFVGEVRGKGLLIGIELVKDRKTKEPLSKTITRAVFDEALRRGLLAMCYNPSIRINPPLTLTQREAEEGAGILDEVFGVIAKRFRTALLR